MIPVSAVAFAALALAAVNFIGLLALAWGGLRIGRRAASALEDARHEFESGFAFLDGRIRARAAPRRHIPFERTGE